MHSFIDYWESTYSVCLVQIMLLNSPASCDSRPYISAEVGLSAFIHECGLKLAGLALKVPKLKL